MTALLRRPVAAEPTAQLGDNLRRLRRERGLTLEALAATSGVSRAMISKIERQDAVPTATVLGRLALGLEVGLSQLVGGQRPRQPTLLRPADQAVFRDAESGLERRSLSPLFPDRHVDFAINRLPPGRSVRFPAHHRGVEEYLHVARGALVVVVDEERFVLSAGDTLFYLAHVPHAFVNEATETAEFYIVVDGTGTR